MKRLLCLSALLVYAFACGPCVTIELNFPIAAPMTDMPMPPTAYPTYTPMPTYAPIPPPPTPPTTGPTPSSPTVTVTPILSSEYPAPALVGPENGAEFTGNETILLIWGTPTSLAEDEWYEVQLWREGEVPYRVVQRVKEGTWRVEPQYYPGRYQWRILVVRGQKDHKEVDLSPPSQTWGFGWLRPSVPVSTASTSPLPGVESVDLTVYLRDTNNQQGFAVFGVSDERINAGTIYKEGDTVYGEVAVRIGDTVYHFDPDPEPGEPEQLPDLYRLEVQFSDSLLAVAGGFKPGFDPKEAQFWVGTLDCNSATPPDKPYTIEMTLYAGGEAQKHTEISFLVADDPLCSVEPDECDDSGILPTRP